jgi:hypothetical protein
LVLGGFEVVIPETKVIAAGHCLLVLVGKKGLMPLLDACDFLLVRL